MTIQHITLQCANLEALLHFYRDTLCFNVVEEEEHHFTLQAGTSLLTFKENKKIDAYYHFAFTIPSNQIENAKTWLQDRVDLLIDEEKHQIIDFPNWNAHAMYFLDPAGNIVEFIARHNLKIESSSNFSVDSIVEISEIGIPVKQLKKVAEQLESKIGIKKWSGDFHYFCAIGDEHGLLIVVDQANKKWFPTDMPSKPYPLDIQLRYAQHDYSISYNGKKIKIQV